MDKKIRPEELLDELGLEGLCRTAEEYFKNIPDTIPIMAKPFHDITETPKLLCKLGQILSGLRLGKGMTVMDFGAGSCWLSRFLNELSCATISVDPSPSALKIGQTLFSQTPPIATPISDPQFLNFNGRKIQLEDNSVDRIIIFDTFHHIPNQEEILKEFYRLLKSGGIAGFSDVGPRHSTAISSQLEMQRYKVLEQDLHIEELKKTTEKIGFSAIYFKLFSHPEIEISYDDYLRIARKKKIPRPLIHFISESMEDNPIFFLVKGEYHPDSRNHLGLAHHLTFAKTDYTVNVSEPLAIPVTIKNTGSALWLDQNIQDIGVVNLGVHLLSHDGQLINNDFLRFNMGKPILPGETLHKTVEVQMPQAGAFKLVFDLVAEHICWFEINNSVPVTVTIQVK